MNELQVFHFNGNEVRTILVENEPWFVLKDVCDILELGNSRMVSDRLDSYEKGVSQIDTLGGRQNMTIINESGLYTVILRSDKPQAKPFQKFVTNDVLPSIRKYGAYMTPETIEKTLSDPDFIIGLATTLKAYQEKNNVLENEIDRMRPQVEYYDKAIERNALSNFRDTAKIIGLRQNEFINWLLENKFIYRDTQKRLKPYAKYDHKYFEIKELPDSFGSAGFQTMITALGRGYFNEIMNG